MQALKYHQYLPTPRLTELFYPSTARSPLGGGNDGYSPQKISNFESLLSQKLHQITDEERALRQKMVNPEQDNADPAQKQLLVQRLSALEAIRKMIESLVNAMQKCQEQIVSNFR